MILAILAFFYIMIIMIILTMFSSLIDTRIKNEPDFSIITVSGTMSKIRLVS